MKKIAQIVLLSTLLTSSVGITFAATFTPTATTVPSSQTTTDPNGTVRDDTQPTSDPNNLQDPAAYNPAILHSPATTTTTDPVDTTDTTVPADQPTRTDDTPTQIPDVPAVTPTTNIPPRQIPGRTTTIPPVAIVTPPIEIPVLETPTCPTIDPLSTQNTECPTKETVSVMPQVPIALMGTSVLGLGLFWFIISYLNGAQSRGERRFTERHLASAHRQHVNESKGLEYQNLLNHLTTELTTKGDFNVEAFQDISAKVQLLGSPEMQNLTARINDSIAGNDRKSLKPLVKELVMQIKKEA